MTHSTTKYVVDLVPVGTDEKTVTLPLIDWDDYGNPRVLWQGQLRSSLSIDSRYARVRAVDTPTEHFIPAAPGWYIRETDPDDRSVSYDPVIAWKATTDDTGEDILLPFVDAGPGCPPFAHTEESFKEFERHVVYRPNHDPATED